MATPANNFVAVCANSSIPLVGSKAAHLKLLKEAGVSTANVTTTADIKERFASLVWARHAVANCIDPSTWTALLSIPLLTSLRSLYVIPPARLDATADISDLHRLAQLVALYMPDVPSAPASAVATHPTNSVPSGLPHPAPHHGTGAGINTQRPPGVAPSPPSPAAQTYSGASGSAPNSVVDLASPPRKRWMMHVELLGILSADAYTALDVNSHLPMDKRQKLQTACQNPASGALFDPTISAPFGHQILLSLSDGAHFDSARRGLALALAGRCAGADASASCTLIEATGRRTLLLEFRNDWYKMEGCFNNGHELSGTNVNRLWDGVSFVMQARAARATTWGCAEVADACRAQYEALSPYRAAIATAVSRAASAFSAAETARNVNTAYLNIFVPFWWEHVLLRARLEEAEATKVVKELLARPPPPVYLPPPPALLHAPPPVLLPAPRPAAPPAAQPRARGFVGKPISALIVGTDIALPIPAAGTGCTCAVSVAFPGRHHRNFECPLRLHSTFGNCPGWTAAGARIPACWNGDVLTAACRTEWRTFAPTLPTANLARGVDVAF